MKSARSIICPRIQAQRNFSGTKENIRKQVLKSRKEKENAKEGYKNMRGLILAIIPLKLHSFHLGAGPALVIYFQLSS
jgi:hypothetical protein